MDHRLAGHGLPYWRRPGFATLLDRLDPDDHVVVWRLCRLDPNFRGVVKALKQLINQQVVVHAIEEFGDFDRLELRTPPGGRL